MNVELLIEHQGTLYQPIVEEAIKWETTRKGVPGKLTFDVRKDSIISFGEGDPVRLKVDGKNVFYGFVFKKGRDASQIISVTAYDQLRYFKNKETYIYANKTASDVIRMIAADFNLQCGDLADTGWVIESRAEDNKTLFDISQTALDLTLQNKKTMFVLYDDFGKLTLKNIEDMKVDLLIDNEAAQNFSYESSIDGETYNKIKLYYENKDTGKRDLYIAQDGNHINEWGVLQMSEKIDDPRVGQAKADALLSLHNEKSRSLSIDDAWGDVRVRGGSAVPVYLILGDIVAKSYMVVEKASHTFKKDLHTMQLTLRGGRITGE